MMTVTPTIYKNVPAVTLENARYRLTLLPGEGAKLVSFQTVADGREFLWQNPAPQYGHIGLTDSYVDGECSSFDDMFPTIDPIVMDKGERTGVTYPDHGEACRLPFSCTILPKGIRLVAESSALQYRYEKTVTEAEDGSIVIDYAIHNLTADPFPSLWAGHCMVQVSDGGQVVTAHPTGSSIDLMFDNREEFGVSGDRLTVTPAMLTSRLSPATTNSYKYYFSAPTPKGFLGYRHADGVTFMMRFDPDALPYIGVWMNDGYFKDCYCVGLEPCNLGYDTVYNAEAKGQTFAIPPKGCLRFALTLSVDE